MKKQNWKKVISLVAGSLVIALVVSILPGGFLVNAADVSRSEAKEIAFEKLANENTGFDEKDVVEVKVRKYSPADDAPYYKVTVITDDKKEYTVKVLVETQEVETEDEAIDLALAKIDKDLNEDDKNVKVSVNDDHADDARKPYYTITVKIEKDNKLVEEYEVRVYINTGEVVIVNKKVVDEEAVKPKQDKIPADFDGIKDLDDFEEYVVDYNVPKSEYPDYNKPTEQAELNMFLRDAKKYAMSELDKDELKVAKDVIKEVKKEFKAEIKDDKKETEKNNDNLVKNVKLTKEQALLIALKKVGVNIEDKQLKQLNTSNKYEVIFDDVDNIEIVLDNDKNPSVYIIKFEYEKFRYTIEVQATTGKILDYSKQKIVEKEDNGKAKEVPVKEDNDNKNDGKGNDKTKVENNGKKNK